MPEAAVGTSSHLQQFSAVRQLTQDLQQRKPGLSKRLQPPPGDAGTPTERNIHTAVYKQKLDQYNNALKLCEQYLNQRLSEPATEINKNNNNVNAIVNNIQTPSSLAKYKSSAYNTTQLPPLRIYISPISTITVFSAIPFAALASSP